MTKNGIGQSGMHLTEEMAGEGKMPDWLDGLTHKDWLFNGSRCSAEQWAQLDWSKAWVDTGPSPAGNSGPYWHVPDLEGDCQHRLYPKVLQSKWTWVIRQAIREAVAKATEPRP